MAQHEIPGGVVHELPGDLRKTLASDAEALMHGRTLRRLRAMNGYAGCSPLKNQKPEGSTLKGYAQNSKRACADLAAGMTVFTERTSKSALQCNMCSINGE